ncbi:MAG TPA: serine hydrolase domain-containing protein [Caulobacteraceae bacterium]|jgi:CubicO group peptidase (beta-lactamase class C family)|nr:serine hydrolase domain-containing protein [Caulobacteraceae bacterium]
MSGEGRFPRTLAVLDHGMRRRLHVGAQLHVRLGGEPRADIALGLAAPGRPMTPDSMMTWLSCSKIAASIAFAQLWEAGAVGLDDPVCRHIPAFAAKGKEAVTIRHLWTHTCGLVAVEEALFPVRYGNTVEQNLELICGSEMAPGWIPGERAFYQTSAAFLLLAEIARRRTGRDFRELVREEVFVPLGMTDSWLGMPADRLAGYAERLGQTFDTSADEPRPGSWAPDQPHQLTHLMPGGNGRGPMRELARLLELLRLGGELDGVRLLRTQTVEAMTARHRTGLPGEDYPVIVDYGLGLVLDSKLHHRGRNCASGFGLHASSRTFGHSGFRTTTAFCDPKPGLVVCCSWNGMVGTDEAQLKRQNALCEAIYEDLGLA